MAATTPPTTALAATPEKTNLLSSLTDQSSTTGYSTHTNTREIRSKKISIFGVNF